MSTLKRRTVTVLMLLFCALIAIAAVWIFSGVEKSYAAEDHSSDTAITVAFLSGLEQNADGTAYILPSGNYYLSSDITTTKTIELEEGASVSLCLNGKTLLFNGGADYRYPVVRVEGASLVVSDCTGEDKGKIDGNNTSGSVVYVKDGDFTLAGGGITGGRGSILFDPYTNAAEVDGVPGYGYGDESFYIQGGGIYALDSDLVISGGAVYGNGVASADARWYGEEVVKYERENIYKDDPSKDPVYEGAIVEGGKHQYFKSGDIVQISRAQGGGVFIGTSYENRENENKSTFVMSGGAISNNVSYLHGAGMFIHNVDFEMRGGVIGGEKQYISAYTATGSPITFDHGGNSARAGLTGLGSTVGGGIYVYRGTERGDGNDIKFSGTAEISYNYATSSSAMTVTEGSTVSISGSVSIAHNTSYNGATITTSGSSFEMSGGAIEYNHGTSHLSVTINDGSVGSFKLSGGYIRNNTGGELGSTSVAGKGASTLLSVSTTSTSKNITLNGVVISDNEMYGSSYVNLSGGAITVKNTVITNNRALKYYSSSGTLTSGGGTAGLNINNATALEISDCTISNNTAESNYAGLYIRGRENGLYTVKDTTVNNNSSAGYSGIYVTPYDSTKNYGELTLENVTVSGNTAVDSYAGVCFANSHYGIQAVLKNVNIISNTTGTKYSGLYLGYNTTAEMFGGSVSGNTAGRMGSSSAAGASGTGAGIYLSGAANTVTASSKPVTDNGAILNANGVTVSGNTVYGSGAGVYIGGGAVKNDGGNGIVVDGAKAVLTDCTVINNTANGYYNTSLTFTGGSYAGVYVGGGATAVNGVYYAHRGALEMNGGSVSGNTGVASSGVYVNGNAKLTNVSVDNNTCGMQRGYNASTGVGNDASGAGIYVNISRYTPVSADNYTFEMIGGSVRGNTSTGSGGGIYMTGGNNRKLTVTLTDVSITGNAAAGYYNASGVIPHGGGIYMNMLSATLSGCDISYNTSTSSGGGMYISNCEVALDNTTVTNNVAGVYGNAETNGIKGDGGGIYMTSSNYNAAYDYSLEVSMSGGAISGNTAYGNGGGIYMTGGNSALQSVSFTLSGTEIKNNLACKYYSSGTVSGGSAYGGGVYVHTTAALPEVIISGGTVYGNSAAYGGGIYVSGSGVSNYGTIGITNGTRVYNNFASVAGGGVYANQYAKVYVSGSTVIVQENGSGTDSVVADNVYLNASSQANTAKILLGKLSGGTKIGITIAKQDVNGIEFADFCEDVESYEAIDYFFSDKSTCVIEKTVDLILVIKKGEGEGATDPVKPDDFAPGSEENPAKTITVDVTVTDLEGADSVGGLVQGATSVYYDGKSADALKVTYIITINEGYYFGALTFNGTRYYFNAYDGYLYYTTDSSSGVRCENSPFVFEDGKLKATFTLSADGENTLALEVGAINDPFSVSGTETTYTGGAHSVSVTRNSDVGGSRVSGLFSFVTSQTVEYMVGGMWTTSEPVDAGRYAVRVVWESTPYVGSVSYGSDIWILVIGAQVWDDSSDNITIELSEDDYVYSEGAFEPEVVVKDQNISGKTLTEGVDYEVTYSNNKAAGVGIVTVVGIGNYDGSKNITFVISKAINTLTYGGLDEYSGYKYNGQTQTVDLGAISAYMGSVAYSIEGPDGASVTISSGTARFSFADAGTYTVTFFTEGNTNYASESREVRIVVAKADNNIDTSDIVIGSYTYNGMDMYLSLAGIDAVGLSSLEVTVDNGGSYDANTRTITLHNAGTYTVCLSIAETANYSAAYAEIVAVVSPMSVARPSEDLTVFVYNGSAQTYNIASNGFYTVTGETTKIDAGSNVIRVTLKDDVNYCWNDGTNAPLSYTFTIDKADPAFTLPSGLTATAGEKLSTVELPAGWSWREPDSKVTSVKATYDAVFTPDDTANYNIITQAVTVKVTAATVAPPAGGTVNGSVSSDTGFAVDTELKMETVKADEYQFDAADMKESALEMMSGAGGLDIAAVYDISLLSGGQNITVSQATAGGSITVTIAIPEELIGKDFYIVHVHNGEVIGVLASGDGYSVKGKNVSFDVDELSQFVFVTERPAEVSAATIVIFAIVDAVLIAFVIFLLVSRRRRRKAQD